MSRMRLLSPSIIGLIIMACVISPFQSSQSTVEPMPTETKLVLVTETIATEETPVIPDITIRTKTPEITHTPDFLPGNPVVGVNELKPSIPWLDYNSALVPVTYYYGFNITKPPFNDALVRRALALAVDRGAVVSIAKSLSGFDAKPATSFTPPDVISRDLYGEIGLSYDPDQAREALSMAGYGNRNDFPEITIYHFGELHDREVAAFIATMWENELGITVNLETSRSLQEFQERLTSNPPGVVSLGWFADVIDPDNFLRELFGSGGSYYGNFSNYEFNQLLDLAAKITNDPLSVSYTHLTLPTN